MAMADSKRSIFRDKALQKYIQNREKSILPHIVAPPVFLFCWALLTVFIIAGVVAWMGQIPVYVTGSGMILDTSSSSSQNNDEAIAAILLPAGTAQHLTVGTPAQVQIGQTGPLLNRPVTSVTATILSPSEIRQQYGLTVTDPSQVVTVNLSPGVSRSIYAGSPIHAQFQVGSQRLLSLFPLFNSLLK